MNFIPAIIAGFIAAIVTTIGIFIINRYAKWGKKNVAFFMSFAAGVLISVSFMHIVPKSFEMSKFAPVFLLIGFLLLHLLNRFLKILVCVEKETKNYPFGIVSALGIGFHSFIDGVIYSVAFSVSIFT
ncbi:ZIP family metal transporter, partial [Candidatus Woesearchaeota archaeon]|nr:ZIP family metal transporter [Candidatus Woesearchaeota archaeon]